MPQTLLNFGANERVDLQDFQELAQAQPVAQAALMAGTLFSRSNANSEMWVLHGFAVRAGVALNANSPAQNQLSVSPGSGLLAWRQGGETPLYGVLAALDGVDQQAQGLDLSVYPSGPYAVWVRLTYSRAALADRTFWNAASPGFEYAQNAYTKLSATWEVQALGAGSNPGAEWLKVATLTWTAPSTQGGSGSVSALADTRPLYFEGNPSASVPFSGTWGSAADRNDDRGSAGVYDLRTMLDALKTCIEDVKGPGLRRWWQPGVGGLNVGFAPATPIASRLAVGDAGLYLQGRTASSPNFAALSFKQTAGSSTFEGFTVGADRVRYQAQGGGTLMAFSQYGTIGFGNLVETDLFFSPGRALVEMVASAQGQSALRLGARAYNGTVPAGIDTFLSIVAPDQAANIAQIGFSRGGVQGTEQRLYQLGKGGNNHFHLYDSVNGTLFLDYDYTVRSLTLGGGAFSFYDNTNSLFAISYAPSTQTTTFANAITTTFLNCLNSATVVQGLTVGGNVQVNSALNVNGVATLGGLTTSGTASVGGLSTSGTANVGSLNASANVAAASYKVGGYTFASFTVGGGENNGSVNIPNSGTPPSNPQPGAIWFRAGLAASTNKDRAYIYAPNWNGASGKSVDGLPNGWVAIMLTSSNGQTDG